MQRIALFFLTATLLIIGCKSQIADTSAIRDDAAGECHVYEQKIQQLYAEYAALQPPAQQGQQTFSDVLLLTQDTTPAPEQPVQEQPLQEQPLIENVQNVSQAQNDQTSADQSADQAENQSAVLQQKLIDLQSQIQTTQEQLQSCMQQKMGQSAANPEGGSGHCDYNPDKDPYDILDKNCHTFANAGVNQDPENTGIVACGGAPEAGDLGHHTFNYRIEGNLIVYYNYATSCKAPLKAVPPDINDPDHQSCVAQFCGNQFGGNDEHVLQPGELVEEPGPNVCSQQSSDRNSCYSCCSKRGTYWDLSDDTIRPTDPRFIRFIQECRSSCSERLPR